MQKATLSSYLMLRVLIAVARVAAYAVVPPLIGIAIYAAILVAAGDQMYAGHSWSQTLQNAWMLESHVFPLLFAAFLIAFHCLGVLSTQFVQHLRGSRNQLPVRPLALGGLLGVFALATMAHVPLSLGVGAWAVSLIVAMTPIVGMLLTVRALERVSSVLSA